VTRVNSQARFPLDEKALDCGLCRHVNLQHSHKYGGWALDAVGKVLKINGYV